MAEERHKTNITAAHIEAFDAVRDAPNIALFSCFVNGEPASAIVAVVEGEDGIMRIGPLFVSVTPGMTLTDHDGVSVSVDPPSAPEQVGAPETER